MVHSLLVEHRRAAGVTDLGLGVGVRRVTLRERGGVGGGDNKPVAKRRRKRRERYNRAVETNCWDRH